MTSFLILPLIASTFLTEANSSDTLRAITLDEVGVSASIKEHGGMRQQPSAVTLIGQQRLTDNHITSLKGAANLVPNLFMPDYGSRLTSAMYIRGIGSRMNTPAVGLYVDNIPYIDKSAFDFNFYDIERIDILRGPQGTLYGRNTMGGLIRIVTRNPFDYDGTDVKLGYATGDNHRNIALTHYHQVNGQLAFSAGGYYEGGDGFFKNDFTYKKADKMQAGGGRIRGIYKATDQLSFDLNVNYDYTDEGAYPYYYTGSFTEYEPYWNLIGKISNNRESSYLRSLFNAGLNIEYKADSWQMNAITGFQHLNDRMLMDQDFLTPDIYTLEQKQRINTLTEEVSFKNTSKDSRWHWVSGANMMYQTLHTDGPVTFYEQGVSGLIESNINGIFNQLKESNPKMPTMGIALQDRRIVVSSLMETPTLNLAIFHNSTFTVGNWKLSAGLRIEYESQKLDYYSNSDVTFDFNIKMSPAMALNYPDLKASPRFDDKMNHDYVQLLPKVSVLYQLSGSSNIYANVSKGHRSGGYNVQMFSDLVQGEMRNQMIASIDEAGKGVVKKMLGDEAYKNLTTQGDVNSVVYKPEYSWNYEIGTHLNLDDHRLQLDAAAFLIDTHDQQIARFAPTGFGRMMVNAGKSRSYGTELSALYRPDEHWTLMGSYGYTHAKFTDYDTGNKQDYTGNYVPFVPRHTLNLDASYSILFNGGNVRSLTFGANCTGTGKIYWTESNSVSQPFYTTFGARASLNMKHTTITLWGKNLTDKKYNTFYFESAGRGFEQHSKPAQVGVDVSLHF